MDHRIFRKQPCHSSATQKLLNCQMHEGLGIVLCTHREIGAKLSSRRLEEGGTHVVQIGRN